MCIYMSVYVYVYVCTRTRVHTRLLFRKWYLPCESTTVFLLRDFRYSHNAGSSERPWRETRHSVCISIPPPACEHVYWTTFYGVSDLNLLTSRSLSSCTFALIPASGGVTADAEQAVFPNLAQTSINTNVWKYSEGQHSLFSEMPG